MQGPSSNSQFFAEFAKPTGEYLDGFAEAVPSLTSTASQLMDNSQSTFHFYVRCDAACWHTLTGHLWSLDWREGCTVVWHCSCGKAGSEV